jgi:hypothetical protein
VTTQYEVKRFDNSNPVGAKVTTDEGEPSEFDRFARLAADLIAVPKEAIRTEAEDQPVNSA